MPDYVGAVAQGENGYTVTNTYHPDPVDLTVTKVWDDADDQDGLRGQIETITLRLTPYAGTEQVPDTDAALQNVVLEKEIAHSEVTREWTYTFEDLPLTTADGQEIRYELHETLNYAEADSAAQQEDRPQAAGTEVPHKQLGGPCPWRSEQHTVPTLTPEAPASATHAAAHQGPSMPLDSCQQPEVLPVVQP